MREVLMFHQKGLKERKGGLTSCRINFEVNEIDEYIKKTKNNMASKNVNDRLKAKDQ